MDYLSIDFILLVLGFVFTFYIPGFLIIETFFAELLLVQKLPLYLLISVLVSTYSVYIGSLIFGFSKETILFIFLMFQIWLSIFLISRKFKIKNSLAVLKDHVGGLFLSLIIFTVFLIALYPAIFSRYQNYFVMSAVNWQDTAMHQSIIQTISQGNFPPQAPYFSGQPLNYYYFIDFHSAILQTLYGDFFPRILVYDNPFFVLLFFLSMYALSYDFFKNRLVGTLAGLLAVFCANFLYYKFFQDIFKNLHKSTNFLITIMDKVANQGYTLDYGQLMQMTPMADYFLQNRPMMIGLPAVVLLIFLIKNGFETNSGKYFILSGLITAALIKFQLFAFGVSILIYLLYLLGFANLNFKERVKQLAYFLIPLIVFVLLNWLLFQSSNYVIAAFLSNFRFGVWDRSKDLFWHLKFPFANFGIPFLFFWLFVFLALLKRINLTKNTVSLLILGIILLIIPYSVYFTIHDGDMLKFFYFALIPYSLISGLLLGKIWHQFHFGPIVVILLILVSSFNGVLTLGWSFFNKNQGYSLADYQAGIWIRNNTLPRSVFMTMPTVHSAVSDIGGRLRALSYTIWPYSHGFNQGDDNVFTRQANLESVYQNPGDINNARRVFNLYHINYLYLGSEEKEKYPLAGQILDQQKDLQLVYDVSGVKIYKVL